MHMVRVWPPCRPMKERAKGIVGVRHVDVVTWTAVAESSTGHCRFCLAERGHDGSRGLRMCSVRPHRGFWSALAERSGDGAFARLQTFGKFVTSGACAESKAAWRFASRRTPKIRVARYKRCLAFHPEPDGWLPFSGPPLASIKSRAILTTA